MSTATLSRDWNRAVCGTALVLCLAACFQVRLRNPAPPNPKEIRMQTPPKPENPKKPQAVPEMVGATGAPFVLEGASTHVSFTIHPPRGPALVRGPAVPGIVRADGTPVRIILRVESITGTQMAPDVDVYLNLPQGAEPKKHPELYAGRLPMFGLAESSTGEDGPTGNGLFHALDITRLYAYLVREESGWDGKTLSVTLVPMASSSTKVRVGRVSLYIA